MTAGAERSGRRRRWLTPVKVALLGSVLVAFLLAWPINIRAPGDHEKMSCGNVLETNLNPWRALPSDGNYWEPAFRACNSIRIDRIGRSVAVISLTVLAVTLVAARTRRASQ